jgi:hypothetical protein
MDLLRAYDDDDLQTFPSGVWGIKEPPDDWKGIRRPTGKSNHCVNAKRHIDMIPVAREAEIDVILVPGSFPVNLLRPRLTRPMSQRCRV